MKRILILALSAVLLAPAAALAADMVNPPLPPPRPDEIGLDRTGEAIRITALARFSAERCDTAIDRVKLDATLARLNANVGYGASGEGRVVGDSFNTVYCGDPRRACTEAWGQLGPDGTIAPGVLIRP